MVFEMEATSVLTVSSIPLLVVAVTCYILWIVLGREKPLTPPGPTGLPIVGYTPFMGKKPPYMKFAELSKKYGDIVSVNLMGKTVISLNSYEAINECFANNGDSFSGRPSGDRCLFWWISDGMSITQEEGSEWREQRRFFFHTQRDRGYGQASMEGLVQELGKELISALMLKRDVPFDPFHQLSNTTLNVMLFLTCSKYCSMDDSNFKTLRKSMDYVRANMSGFSAMYNSSLFPVQWYPKYKNLCENKKNVIEECARHVKEHEATYNESNLRDFIDDFLYAKKTAEKNGELNTSFTADRLERTLLGLLVTGSETTSNTLYWAIRIICQRQDVQKKLRAELDEVVGRDRLPSILDRPNMPYLEAFTMELLRYSTISPLGLPHCNPEPTFLWGHPIPARSIIFGNVWAVNNDARYWDEPEKFVPERFLDPVEGKQRMERVLNFSIGKRACMGEAFARMELFIFLTMMLQKFVFKLANSNKEKSNKTENSFIRALIPFKIIIKERS